MTHPVRRVHEAHAAWFIVPVALAGAGFAAIGILDGEQPAVPVAAAVTPAPAADVQPAKTLQDPIPEASDHVQAF